MYYGMDTTNNMRPPVGPLKRISFFIPHHLRYGQFLWNVLRSAGMIEPDQAQKLYAMPDLEFRQRLRWESNKYLKEGYEGKNVRNKYDNEH